MFLAFCNEEELPLGKTDEQEAIRLAAEHGAAHGGTATTSVWSMSESGELGDPAHFFRGGERTA